MLIRSMRWWFGDIFVFVHVILLAVIDNNADCGDDNGSDVADCDSDHNGFNHGSHGSLYMYAYIHSCE